MCLISFNKWWGDTNQLTVMNEVYTFFLSPLRDVIAACTRFYFSAIRSVRSQLSGHDFLVSVTKIQGFWKCRLVYLPCSLMPVAAGGVLTPLLLPAKK